jgi:hypothetical protein
MLDEAIRIGFGLLQWSVPDTTFDRFFDTLLQIGNAAFAGNPSLAQSIVDEATQRAERLYDQDPLAFAERVTEAGMLYYRHGQFVQAHDLWQRILDIYQHIVGEKHPDTVTAMNNLALTLHDEGDLASARSLQEQVLER